MTIVGILSFCGATMAMNTVLAVLKETCASTCQKGEEESGSADAPVPNPTHTENSTCTTGPVKGEKKKKRSSTQTMQPCKTTADVPPPPPSNAQIDTPHPSTSNAADDDDGVETPDRTAPKQYILSKHSTVLQNILMFMGIQGPKKVEKKETTEPDQEQERLV